MRKENNKNPGTSQLGHSPMSKVKLEGPKKHHDFHGTTDSVPTNKHIPGEHWEKIYNATGASKYEDMHEGDAFNPQCPGKRKTTHIKVNECDH